MATEDNLLLTKRAHSLAKAVDEKWAETERLNKCTPEVYIAGMLEDRTNEKLCQLLEKEVLLLKEYRREISLLKEYRGPLEED